MDPARPVRNMDPVRPIRNTDRRGPKCGIQAALKFNHGCYGIRYGRYTICYGATHDHSAISRPLHWAVEDLAAEELAVDVVEEPRVALVGACH